MIKKYRLKNTEREVHMKGNYVGVCWNLRESPEYPDFTEWKKWGEP